VNRVIRDPVHGPAQKTALPLDLPYRLRSPLRRPGENRNLRMRHSIRDQDLLPFGVIG
jgi:hypothetical protein